MPPSARWHVRRCALLVIGAASVAVGLFGLGRATTPGATWDQGAADVSAGRVTLETGNWTYAVPADIPWVDSAGTLRDHGAPTCLTGSTARAGNEVTFAWAEAPGLGARTVVAVDCR